MVYGTGKGDVLLLAEKTFLRKNRVDDLIVAVHEVLVKENVLLCLLDIGFALIVRGHLKGLQLMLQVMALAVDDLHGLPGHLIVAVTASKRLFQQGVLEKKTP